MLIKVVPGIYFIQISKILGIDQQLFMPMPVLLYPVAAFSLGETTVAQAGVLAG